MNNEFFEANEKAINEIEESVQKLLDRLSMAVFGDLSLLVPMLIMVLHKSLLTTLLTTSVFVIVVDAVPASVMNDSEPKDIVGATTACAAIVVVFVGTGGSDKKNKTSISNGTI